MENLSLLRQQIALQALVTLFLVLLFRTLHSQLYREKLFWWWSWAWTAFGMSLFCGWISLEVPGRWAGVKSFFILLSTLAGFLEMPLLVYGPLSFKRPQINERAAPLAFLLAAAAGGGAALFALSLVVTDPVAGHAWRAVPRFWILGGIYFWAAWVIGHDLHPTHSTGTRVTALFCGLYGVLYLDFGIELLPGVGRSRLPLNFLDLAFECGIALGAVLILLENYHRQRQRLALYEQILPTCSVCGSVRDDTGRERGTGEWIQLQAFITRHSTTQLSHTLCPRCLEEFSREHGIDLEESTASAGPAESGPEAPH